jgi:hypothetical protein
LPMDWLSSLAMDRVIRAEGHSAVSSSISAEELNSTSLS